MNKKNNVISLKLTSHIFFSIMIILSLGILVFSTVNAYKLVGQTFSGFSYFDFGERYMFINATNQTHWTGMTEGGLKFQDVVTAINKRRINSYKDIREEVKKHPAGTPLEYMVITWKNSEIRRVRIPTMIFTLNDFWITFGLKLLVSLVLIIMVFVVYLVRPFAIGTWAFCAFNLSLSLFVITSFDAGFNHEYSWLFWLSYSLVPASLFHLVVRYPEENNFCTKFKFIVPFIYIFHILLSILPYTPLRSSSPYLIRNMIGVIALTTGIVGLFFFASMYRLYRSTKETRQSKTALKVRVKILTLGAFLAFIVPASLSAFGVWQDKYYISFNYISLFFLIFPFTAAIALVQYNLFDIDVLLKKLLSTSFYIGMIIGLYFAIFSICLGSTVEKLLYSPFFALIFSLFTFILSGPFNKIFTKILTLLFAKNHKTYQQFIGELSQQLTSVLTREEIMNTVARTLIDDLNIRQVSIWISKEPEHAICYREEENIESHYVSLNDEIKSILYLWKNRMEPLFITEIEESPHFNPEERKNFLLTLEFLNSVLIFPLFVKKELTGLIFLGERENELAYNSNDIELLLPLSYQLAIALENATSYEKIQELNESLELKVEERTSELLKTMKEKEKTQEQLIRSESLAAIGQLVAGVAHELNNPLGSAHSLVQSAVEIMEEKEKLTPDEEDIVDDLKFVIKEQKRAKDIVSSLLDLSRQTESYEEPVQLNQVIEDSIRVLHNKYKYLQINIKTQYDENLPVVQGNFAQLGQVCLNIIQNAIQAAPSKDGQIVLKTSFNEKNVQFQCLDNGKGIPEKALKDIFKPFFTTKVVGEGTGLGLYICHDIISRHQGTINVYNSEIGGAISEIQLPLMNAS